MAAPLAKLLDTIKRSRFLRFGLPMIVIVVGGSFGLKEFRTLRYEIIDKRKTGIESLGYRNDSVLPSREKVRIMKRLLTIQTCGLNIQEGNVDPETEEKMNAKKKKEKVTIEGEFERLQQEDIDTWHNIRGPRPWENSKEFQDMQRGNVQKQLTKKAETTSQ